ncbi:MAG: 3-dehydroquinate synthase [Armatimonadota bacterium]|nr:3-dehydroquinate synthase [Armatimonadota bacterium]
MKHLYLVGNMGSGKSTVGKQVAQHLGLPFVDLDACIERAAGMPIATIFDQEGEPAFRQREQEALRAVAQMPPQVVATGGGVVLNEANWQLMRQTGWIIYLQTSVETLWQRVRRSRHRPLLRTETPRATLEAIVHAREPLYQQADWIVPTDGRTPEQVAEAVLRAFRPTCEMPLTVEVLPQRSEGYPVLIAPEIVAQVATHLQARLHPTRVVVLTHLHLLRWATPVCNALDAAGIPYHLITLPSGERIKSLRIAERLYTQLLAAGVDRSSALIVVGGGVLGDLGGFVAATYMRGIPYAQVPTTLLAQVDSSVGGKVAVDLPQGKNLVGVFHQPALVVVDPETLTTLPLRHWRNGLAEMLKYGIALHAGLWQRLQTILQQGVLRRRALRNDPYTWTLPIAQCIHLKAAIVAEDERDLRGKRALLNFGHTVGHAIEATLGYRRWLHGEAIAVGMVAEAELGRILGITPAEVVETLRQTLAYAGLPTHLPRDLSPDALLEAMRYDKKRVGDALRIVLLEDVGKARLEPKIPLDALREALQRCTLS